VFTNNIVNQQENNTDYYLQLKHNFAIRATWPTDLKIIGATVRNMRVKQ